jgi:hypothetical protein
LLTEQSIEERVWETLKLKRSLFTGLFDSTSDEVSFEKLGRKSTMQVIKETFCDQPSQPKPIISPQVPAPVVLAEAAKMRETAIQPPPAPVTSAEVIAQSEGPASMLAAQEPAAASDSRLSPLVPDARQAAANLLEAGLTFLEAIALPAAGSARATDHSKAIERAFSSLMRIDPQTQRPVLTLPLPERLTAERVTGAISGLLNKLARAS